MAKMGRPPAVNPKNQRMMLRMDAALMGRLKAFGEANGVAITEIARIAIRDYLKKHEKKQQKEAAP